MASLFAGAGHSWRSFRVEAGGVACTRLQCALPCVAAFRTVYEEVCRFEREVVRNDSTYWLIFELLWRDYFKLLPTRPSVGPAGLFKLGGVRSVRKPWVRAFARHRVCACTSPHLP